MKKAKIKKRGRPWYSPSRWAASILRRIADKMPEQELIPGTGITSKIVASGIYGVAEVCGISGLIPIAKIGWNVGTSIMRSKLNVNTWNSEPK